MMPSGSPMSLSLLQEQTGGLGGGCRVCRAAQPLQGLMSSVWGPLMLFVQNLAQAEHLEQK